MATRVLLYGIVNCDTMKKARAWLDGRKIAYEFRDYKKSAPTPALLAGWADACGWETLLNRAGTTFRKLPESETRNLTQEKAIALMLAQPSMIKRPVLDVGGRLLVGFKTDQYAKTFPS